MPMFHSKNNTNINTQYKKNNCKQTNTNTVYAIVAFMFAAPYNGIKTIVMPKFELPDYLALVQKYKV